MEGSPFCTGGVLNMGEGQDVMDFSVSGIPADKVFVIEFAGINAAVQLDQEIVFFIAVRTNGKQFFFPIDVTGSFDYKDAEFPKRIFGSQQVLLYADPNAELKVSAGRNNSARGARIIFSLSGRLVTRTW